MERKTKTLTLTPRLTVALAGTVMACLLIGGILSYAMSGLATSSQIHDLQNQVSTLKQTVSDTQSQDSSSSQTSTIVNSTYIVVDNFSLPELYEKTKNSVVVVRATTVTEYYGSWGQPYYQYGEVQGSGFVYNSTGQARAHF